MRRTPPAALGAPRFVDETATAGHRPDVRRASSRSSSAAASPSSTATTTGGPTLYVAGGERTRRRCTATTSPIGGALRFRGSRPGDRPRRGRRAPTRSTSTATAHIDLAVLRDRRERPPPRPRRLPVRAGERGWALDGGDGPTTAFSATWEATATLPTLAFGNYLDPARPDAGRPLRRNELVRPMRPARGYAAPIPLTPGYCALSMLFSDWDRSGRRDLRVSNDRHYYDRTARSSCGGSSPGDAPRLYTADDGWVRMQVEGMGIASYDLTGDGYPEVYLTSQGANRLQTLTSGPDQADVSRHRAEARRRRRPPVHRRRPAPLDRLAPRVRGRQQRRATSTCSSRRATSTSSPTSP